jgi:hypothetical protein
MSKTIVKKKSGRGPAIKFPLNDATRGNLEMAAKWTDTPIEDFRAQVEAGLWDGAFAWFGEKRIFFYGQVIDVEKQLCIKSINLRRKAA